MKTTSPFHKNPVLWLVVLLPLTTVVVGLIFLVFSIKNYDGVVIDDYYKKGKQINKTLERDELAVQFDLKANLNLDAQRHLIFATLDANQNFKYPEKVELKFIHRTLSEKDIDIDLQYLSGNNYQAVLPQIEVSRWQIELGTASWRLRGYLDLPEQSIISLSSPEPR